MYAVFQNGNKQYKITEGQIVRLEKIDVTIGNIIEFKEILIIVYDKKIEIGTPFVNDNIIKAEVIAHGRDKKLKIIKFHRRKHYRKHQGHRQWFTDVKIIGILKIKGT